MLGVAYLNIKYLENFLSIRSIRVQVYQSIASHIYTLEKEVKYNGKTDREQKWISLNCQIYL